MSNYTSVPTAFTYSDSVHSIISDAQSGTPEYWLKINRRSNAFPPAIDLLNYYALMSRVAIYTPRAETIKRSTDLRYYFNILTTVTREATDNEARSTAQPLLYSPLQIEAYNLKDVCAIHLVPVMGQIQETFETHIPAWAAATEASETLGVSLALKLTPKHRVRVYTRNNHIIVFTTKGLLGEGVVDDYQFLRRVWACLPLLRSWPTTNISEGINEPELIELCKLLADNNADNFWTRLEQAYASNKEVQDIKYRNIINAFNSIQTFRIDGYTRQIQGLQNDADTYLKNYADRLEAKRKVERELLALQQTDFKIDTEVIKRLVDKRICYGLYTNSITNSDGLLSYRCSAPLVSYDKDAAKVLYSRRVKNDRSKETAWLFKKLFLDEQVVLNFDEAIDIKLNRGTIQAKQGCTNLYNDLHEILPNPHHYHYNCWGNYGGIITRLIHEYKLEELFYQIKAAVGSINFADYPVMGQFLTHLDTITERSYNPRCFLWRDENCITLHTFDETFKHFAEEATEE